MTNAYVLLEKKQINNPKDLTLRVYTSGGHISRLSYTKVYVFKRV